MEKIRNRYFIVIAILLLSSMVVNLLSYEKFHNAEAGIQVIKKIPIKFGKWQGTDMPLEERIFEILETRSIIHRNYSSNGQNVFLSIVYYPESKVDFHSPEGCLGGKGIQVSKTVKIINIADNKQIKLNQLIRQDRQSNELIFYFYKTGDFIGQNYIKLRMNLAKNKFLNSRKSGALIRLSTPMQESNAEEPSQVLTDFISGIYPFINDL